MRLPFPAAESLTAVFLPGLSPLEHLARESALLAAGRGGGAYLLFYVNSPCLVIGRNQNPWRELDPDSPIPFYRRESGGGTVYHDAGNLNWALVVPREEHDQDAELRAMASAISSLGPEVLPGLRGGLYLGPSSAQPGAKVSGTARRFTPDFVLHHGTLLISSDLAALEVSLGGMPTLDDPSLPSVRGEPANLADEGMNLGPFETAQALSALLGAPDLRVGAENLGDESAYRAAREKYASPEWRFGATPRFSLDLYRDQVSLPGRGAWTLLVEAGKPRSMLRGSISASGPGAAPIELPSRFSNRYLSRVLIEEIRTWAAARRGESPQTS